MNSVAAFPLRLFVYFVLALAAPASWAATTPATRPATAPATKIDLASTKNSVEFLAVGNPSALKIRGKLKKSEALTGSFWIEGGTLKGKATLQLAELDTGIELRNTHMKDTYLQVTTHPTATVEITPVVLAKDTTSWDGPFQGTLELHGVKKPLTGTLSYKPTDENRVRAQFSLTLEDFGIQVPKYMGITVSKTVTVEVAVKQ